MQAVLVNRRGVAPVRIMDKFIVDDLDGKVPVKLGALTLLDGAYPAAELLDDPVM
jgi:hypothetical protein